MFEFLRNGPLGRLKFVQRMLDRRGSSRQRRRLSAGTDDEDVVSETEEEVDARHHRGGPPPSGDPEEHSIDCTERRVADQPTGSDLVEASRPGDGRARSAKAEAPTTRAAASAAPKNEEVADRESAQAVVGQRASAALSVGRPTARADVPLHARGRYSIECDVGGGSSVAKEATAPAAAAAAAAEAVADVGPPARRRSSWHSSLRQPKAKSAVQLSKLRISFRKKPSASQADYNVLSDDGHHFDISGSGNDSATTSEMTPAARARLTDGHGDVSAINSDAASAAAGAASGEELPKSSQAVAEALRRSFRKTSKYFRYGTQSMTITKPATSLNWAASSSTKQTLI